jgi:hypothetical protein
MVSLSNHEVVPQWCHALVLRQAQDEVYWYFRPGRADLKAT